jgi:hypothetical protein
MRCLRYDFQGEEQLEELLIEMWIRVEKMRVKTPEVEIWRYAGAKGTLLIGLQNDPPLKVLRRKRRCRSLHQAAIFRRYEGYRPAGYRLHSTDRGSVRRRKR